MKTKEEQKAYRKLYNARPEIKAKLKAKRATPENKTYIKTYQAKPEVKARRKLRNATSEVKAKNKEYYTKPERKAYVKAYYSKPEYKINRKIYNAKPEVKRKNKKYSLKQKFGITPKQYNEMFIKQNGCCAICKKPQIEFKLALAVDHDHKTNEIRGLLCGNCNRLLGYSKDNEKTLLNAIQYLNKYKSVLM
jgi:hypothetical protein